MQTFGLNKINPFIQIIFIVMTAFFFFFSKDVEVLHWDLQKCLYNPFDETFLLYCILLFIMVTEISTSLHMYLYSISGED